MASDKERIEFLESHVRFWQGAYEVLSDKISDVYEACLVILDGDDGLGNDVANPASGFAQEVLEILDDDSHHEQVFGVDDGSDDSVDDFDAQIISIDFSSND